MRYDVKKFLFVGVEDDRAEFFRRAQDAGIIQFINAKHTQLNDIPVSVKKIANSLKILRTLPPIEQEEIDSFALADDMAQQIIDLQQKLDALKDEERNVRVELSRVAPLGDFSLDDIAYIEKEGKCKVQFYAAKRGFKDHADLPDQMIHVASENAFDYFIAINQQTTQYPKMIEIIIDRPLGALKRRYQEIQNEMHESDHLLKSYAKYNRFLRHALVHHLNQHHLAEATNDVKFPLEEDLIFSVQGWVPQHQIGILQQFVTEMNVHVEEIANDPNDIPPTFLENTGAARLGEDLVHIYDTPSHTDKDPSVWVLVFFSIFFTMIIGDGGYGLVMLLVALYLRNKLSNLTKAGKRALDLFTILCFSLIAWGVLTTSFFGITIAPDSHLRKVSLMSWLVEKKVEYVVHEKGEVHQQWVAQFPQLDSISHPTHFLMEAHTTSPNGLVSYDVYNKFADNIMMELALLVGVIHVIFSMLRYIKRNPQNVGWIIFLVGAYLYTPYFLDASSILNFVFGINRDAASVIGLYMMCAGFIIASVVALIKHKLLGLLEPTILIQIFGDVLSYIRLYALGLSGSLLTSTMNEMAASAPLFFGIIILLIGHVVNICLGIQGGIIHGLRLNFLEWYHYSFDGGGKRFNALKKLQIE